ncbi:Carbon-nitrogen hydrolase, partial [Coelomomyces lativittatus]
VGFGICMDLNPYQFKSDFYLCEFANFQLSKKSKWVFCLMNWLESDPPTSSMIPYWIERLRPLDRTETTVLICNRLGKEKNNLFCGQSCLIQFTKNGIETSHCGKDEGLFLINV